MISLTSNLPGTKRANERGQISIFFASSLIVLISIIAFVINIGLFVKAKINLQNATDAAAYAGAAVQSRMLTRIGYMNWELRNNYKEWMFKYYILGNLNIDDVRNPPGTGKASYRMLRDPNINDTTGDDPYNFPSVCLHYAGVSTNVCRKYGIPGIPRFEPTNLVGIDETTSAFIDAIVKEKANDCSKRTQLNFNVTNLWAYNLKQTGPTSAFEDSPQVAVDRVGAWPKAVELAIRTRALEYAMNRPPVVVCGEPSLGFPGCRNVLDLLQDKHYGNERPAKAYWSGMRNLGAENGNDGELKASFTLTELAPQPVSFADKSLSTMLSGPKGREPKQYLDLKIQLVNYAMFFSSLIARDDGLDVGGQRIKAEGACDVSKIAIPVPGYPLGFYKNPELVTYYAVKGEANFQGLFNPFTDPGVIKLTAFAAAKPMGGRIGPALFRAGSGGSDETAMTTRTTATNRRSTAYLSGINLSTVKRKGTNINVPVGEFASGMPIPINKGTSQEERFWISEPTDQVGGWVSGPGIVFGIPNMVYDFEGTTTDPSSYISSLPTNIVLPGGKGVGDDGYAAGLYQGAQLSMLAKNLVGVDTVKEITESIYNVRAPTAYEAANYTIPVPYDLSIQQSPTSGAFLDTFGFIAGPKTSEVTDIPRYQVALYAPLYSQNNKDALFSTAAEVGTEIKDFMNMQVSAMEKYRNSMNIVAKSIFDDDPTKYRAAAERISDYPFSSSPTAPDAKPTCKSIAGSFLHYYFGSANTLGNSNATGVTCPVSLADSIDKYFTDASIGIEPHTHVIEYTYRPDHPRSEIIKWDRLLTGYMPGTIRGATDDGLFSTPFSGEQEAMRRTGYSTKFVTLKSLTSSGNYTSSVSNAPIYTEGMNTGFFPLGEDVRQNTFRNALDLAALGVPTTVNH